MATSATQSQAIERGRHRLQQVILLFIGIDLIVTFLYMGTIGTPRAPQQIIRALISVGLAWALWRGYNWSRWVVLILTLAGIVLLSSVAFNAITEKIDAASLFLLLMTIGYIAVARILLWSSDVRVFMAAQRDRRSDPGTAAA